MTIAPPEVRRAKATIAAHKRAQRKARPAKVQPIAAKVSTQPGKPTKRRKMTMQRKQRIHTQRDGLCAWCNQPVEMFGPTVIYDHYEPLALMGADEDHNIRPLHASPCDKIKTAFDKRRIAKAKRQARHGKPKPNRRPIPSRAFS